MAGAKTQGAPQRAGRMDETRGTQGLCRRNIDSLHPWREEARFSARRSIAGEIVVSRSGTTPMHRPGHPAAKLVVAGWFSRTLRHFDNGPTGIDNHPAQTHCHRRGF